MNKKFEPAVGIVRKPEGFIYSSATVYAGYGGFIDIIPITLSVKTVK